jgi:hypothetical protein
MGDGFLPYEVREESPPSNEVEDEDIASALSIQGEIKRCEGNSTLEAN